jgi:hypothetical protein
MPSSRIGRPTITPKLATIDRLIDQPMNATCTDGGIGRERQDRRRNAPA